MSRKKSQLARFVAQINRHTADYQKIGMALTKILENRLYTEVADSFNVFCVRHLGMSRVHAYRYVSAARVAQNLLPMGDKPMNERQTRPLVNLSKENQRLAFQYALDLAKAENRRVMTPDILEGIRILNGLKPIRSEIFMDSKMKQACIAFEKEIKQVCEDGFKTTSKGAILKQLQKWMRFLRYEK